MRLRTFLAVVLLSAPAIAYSAQAPLQFTPYDRSLGKAHTTTDGDTSFGGSIELSGKLHVVRAEGGNCKVACAFFVPDKPSQGRLPRRIIEELADPYPADSIDLGEAGPVLTRALGKRSAAKILGSDSPVYVVPARATLRRLRVYWACDAAHYSAVVRSIRIDTHLAVRSEFAEAGGC